MENTTRASLAYDKLPQEVVPYNSFLLFQYVRAILSTFSSQVLNVFRYLNPRELVAVAATCKNWNKLVDVV